MKKIVLTIAFILCICYVGAQSEKDRKFAKEAAETGSMEIKLGELAQSKGTTAEVKTLGSHMVTDHTKSNNELKTIAASKNIPLPTALNDKGQRAYEKLSKKEGKKFDKAYTQCMVKHHKKSICKFKKQAKKGDDAELRSWASNTLPVLEHHKEMSKEACKSVKKK